MWRCMPCLMVGKLYVKLWRLRDAFEKKRVKSKRMLNTTIAENHGDCYIVNPHPPPKESNVSPSLSNKYWACINWEWPVARPSRVWRGCGLMGLLEEQETRAGKRMEGEKTTSRNTKLWAIQLRDNHSGQEKQVEPTPSLFGPTIKQNFSLVSHFL